MYAHFETIIDFLPNGQLQLPELIKQVLQTPKVRVTVTTSQVRLEPVRELAGCLKQYAPAFIPIEPARAMAWSEVVDEKHRRD
jgi:hypothetical protein